MPTTPSDHVKVRNEDTADLRVRFDSRDYIVPAKGDAILPREAACKDFGDWTAQNGARRLGVVRQWRQMEYERLRGLYGALDGFEGADARFEANSPKVSIWEGDLRVISVLEDPKGEAMPVTGSSDERKEAELESLKQQVAELRDIVGKGGPIEARSGSDVPTDTPEIAPRRRKRQSPIEAAQIEEE